METSTATTETARGRTLHPGLRTIDVARRAGCSVQHLRDLQRADVLPPTARTPSGYRRWEEAHVRAAVAYRNLSQGIGPARAKGLLQALHRDPPAVFLAMLDDAHAQLARERHELRLAREAVAAIAAEPLAAPRPSDDMTISELAAALGTTPATLRHWQAEDLLTPHRAGPGRVRTYPPVQVRNARVIHQLRTAGYGIPQLRVILRQLADLGDDGDALRDALHVRDRHLTVRSHALLRAAAAVNALLATGDAAPGANQPPADVP